MGYEKNLSTWPIIKNSGVFSSGRSITHLFFLFFFIFFMNDETPTISICF